MNEQLFTWEERCMGTYFKFQISTDRSSAETARFLNDACKFLHDADNTFSLYKKESELSRIARKELSVAEASEGVRSIFNDCEHWKLATDGWFDAVNPEGVFDPSGIVKTWAAQQACIYLEANGFNNFTLNAGGDVYLSSELQIRSLYKVGLANLNRRTDANAGSSMLIDLFGTPFRAAATSGSIERGEHIWSKGGEVANQAVLQVTVVADDLITADVWATAIYAGGIEALEAMTVEGSAFRDRCVAAVTFSDGALLASRGFAALLASH